MTRPQFEGTKGSDADRVKVVRGENSDNRLHQLPWILTRLQPHRLAKLAIAVPGCDKGLGSAEFHRPVKVHRLILACSSTGAKSRKKAQAGERDRDAKHAMVMI
jgi:hypothetical protein